ncbi:hypothetical protein TNCV_5082081 [Trichonephila clavipes]|nr:hypothetical protein TNCV_5082081 [Trichonephila clavipes]
MPGFCQMIGTPPPLLDSMVGGDTPGRSCVRAYGSNAAVPGSLNTNQGVISEPDLLSTSEFLEGFSDQVSTSSSSIEAHLLPSTSTISESQPTIPTFNTNDPLYSADQAIFKKSKKQLLPKYNETSTHRLQISKSNIFTQIAASAVKHFAAQKLPLKPRKKKRHLKTIFKDIEIKMIPYKPKKGNLVKDTSDEEYMLVYAIFNSKKRNMAL